VPIRDSTSEVLLEFAAISTVGVLFLGELCSQNQQNPIVCFVYFTSNKYKSNAVLGKLIAAWICENNVFIYFPSLDIEKLPLFGFWRARAT